MDNEATEVAANDAAAPSVEDALSKAFEGMEEPAEAVEPQAAAPEPEAEAEAPEQTETDATGPDRDEKGRFKAKDGTETTAEPVEPDGEGEDTGQDVTSFTEPPSRFSPDAKEAWKTAPEPVRAEITRAIKELEQGIEKYRGDFEPYREFDQQIKQNGQTFKQVLDNYTGIENKLRENPMEGLDTICRNMGTSLRQVAEQVLNQPPDQSAAQQESVINDLRREIQTLKDEVGGVSSHISQQKAQSDQEKVNAFANDHARFEELRFDMAMFMENGRANDMQEAYDLAERLNPAPAVPAPPVADNPAPTDQTAQTRKKGQLSVTGAPSSGSNPVNRKVPQSAEEAVTGAFAQVGL